MAPNFKKIRIAAFDSSQAPFPLPYDFPRPLAPLIIAVDIAEGLAKRGHEVYLYGPRGSRGQTFKAVEIDFEPLYQNKIWEFQDVRGTEKEKIASLFDQHVILNIFQEHQRKPFDIIHIHPVDRVLAFAPLFPEVSVVSTLHDPIFKWRAEVLKMMAAPNIHLISISNAQRTPAPDLNYAATVYNGIRTDIFRFNENPEDYLFFAGRLEEKKGVFEAIQAAQATNSKLLIAGSPSEGKYWDEKIAPHLNDKIRYIGLVPYEEIAGYFGNAKVFLFPILWDEPFGLVMAEAMAAGTPVIAFNRGSVPEVVVDGKTGFIVKTVEEMVEAIRKVDQIDRRRCRKHVEDNFSVEKMVDGYEQAFLKILNENKFFLQKRK